MSIAQQLYHLQELDIEIESHEEMLRQKTAQLADNAALVTAQNQLADEQKHLEELKHQQRSLEWEIDDLTSKIKSVESQLYGGRITNPKELMSLQHEANTMKASRDQIETRVLEMMEQVESAEARVATARNELKKITDAHQIQQQQLTAEINQCQAELADLISQRQTLLSGLDASALATYEKLRKQKGQAVARVEQGICRACRISLSSSQMQQVRSGNLIPCGSCGRILFLP